MDENKDIEDKLKESEKRFRSYFNLTLVGMAITSPEKGWIEVNDKVCSMFGYTREEILKMTWAEITHPLDLAIDEKQFNKLLSGEIEQYNIDKRYIRKDKTFFWTNLSVGCVKEPNGKIDYLTAVIIDITDRKEIEEKLMDQNLLMATILENAPIGFAVNNMNDGKAIFVSSKFEEIYGVEKGSITSVGDFFEKVYIDPVYREKMKKQTEDDMASGDKSKMKWDNIPLITKNGDKKYITAFNIPIPDQNLMVSTVQDSTERVTEDETLKEKFEEIEKLNKLMVGRELEMIKLKEEVKEYKNHNS